MNADRREGGGEALESFFLSFWVDLGVVFSQLPERLFSLRHFPRYIYEPKLDSLPSSEFEGERTFIQVFGSLFQAEPPQVRSFSVGWNEILQV